MPIAPVRRDVTNDRSLDEFLDAADESDAEGAEPTDAESADDSDAPEAADAEAADAGDPGEGSDVGTVAGDEPTSENGVADVPPAKATYEWSPAGRRCQQCGDSVRRRWEADDALVCRDCKTWQ